MTLQRAQTLYQKLFIEETQNSKVQFIRYGFVAGVAFVFDFGLLFVFTSMLNMHYLLSATLSFAISVVVNYALSTKWVFTQRVERERAHEIALFVAICTVALGLNDLFMWIFTSGFGIYYIASKVLTVVLVFFWSFGARRYFFNRRIGFSKYFQRSK